MDPGTALAIVSLALDVGKDILKYCEKVKDAGEEHARLRKRTASFQSILETIRNVLEGQQCRGEVLQKVVDLCVECNEAITKLRSKLDKYAKLAQGVGRLLYPLKRSKLCKLEEMIEDVLPPLNLALGVACYDGNQRSIQRGFGDLSKDFEALHKNILQFHSGESQCN